MTIRLSLRLIIVSIYILKNNLSHRLTTSRQTVNDSYDFIIVGSGSAGSVVANRLSENPNIRVLCLEAGGPASLRTDLPAMASVLVNSQYNWNYSNAPQAVGVGWADHRIKEHRGKVLGGTSSINSMLYNRGNKYDYDYWEQHFGAKGWGYEEVMPYFLKFEDNTDPTIIANNPDYHSIRGPVQISTWRNPDPIVLLYQKAMNEFGFPETDINGPQQWGTAIAQTFISGKGTRSSTSNSYIDPNPHLRNLDILSNALVVKIHFTGNTARSVEFVRNGVKRVVSATKEIIVCAGAINSPQLLMLSGIGPKEHLQQLRIPVLADLPVGDHLQNHPRLDIRALIKDESLVTVSQQEDYNALTIDNLYQYFISGSGPLTLYYNSITYLSTESNNVWPNIALESRLRYFPKNVIEEAVSYENVGEWERYYRSYAGRHYLYIMPILQRVRSFGSLRLQSTDPLIYPTFTPNFLTDPEDYADFLSAVKFAFNFIERSSFAQYLVPLQPIPGCSFCDNQQYIYQCESYIKCHIRQVVWSVYHDVGTCSMGAVDRDDVVVDPRLRVKGINRLRVCDASVMPQLPNSNTNAPAIMIGEKCSAMVKQDHNL